jgi:tripartite-type tricarboxylate transporter receptor subunit TctC
MSLYSMTLGSSLVIPLLFVIAGLPAAHAQSQKPYPSDVIRFVSGYPVGSGADVLVRYFAEKIGRISGATIITENRPGATGNIATEHVARSKPDGYTVLVHAGSGIAGNANLYKSSIDATKDLQLVATMNKQGTMIVVPASSPYRTLSDLTAAMKAKKSAASYGTSSTTGTITGEMYKQVAGLESVLVHYKAAPNAVKDMIGGQLDYTLTDPLISLAERRKGNVRILANFSPERMKSSPDVPTMRESGVDVSLLGWWAAAVPAATPRAIVDQLNGWFNKVLVMPETEKFMEDAGGDVFISTPDDAHAFLVKEVKAWETYVRIGKIKAN